LLVAFPKIANQYPVVCAAHVKLCSQDWTTHAAQTNDHMGGGTSKCLTMHALALRWPILNPRRRKEAMMAVINQTAEQ